MYSRDAAEALVAAECMAAKVRRVHRVLVGRYDRALRPHGLTVGQLDLLATLLEHGGAMRPTDLGRRLLMDRSTVSRDLDRLATAGLVQVGPGPSRRERVARVTERGRRRVEDAFVAWAQVQRDTERLLGRRGKSALETLVRLVDRHETE